MKEVPEKKPTGRTQADTPAPAPAPGLSPHSVQRLQGAVGNAAVARLVAQRYTAPVKTPANAAPGFRRVGADVAAKKRTMAAHPPAAAESKSAQDAAVAPPDDKEAQGKAANAEKMNAAKPGEFDKAAFVAAVDKAIEAQAPKNLDEADKFSKSGKADKVKDEVDGKVTDGKNTSAKDIETTTKAPPDTSAAKDKPVTPMTPDNAPGNPGAPSAADAIPEKQPPAVTDFSQGPAENDKAMADAEVTEEQLAKGNEPEFDDALKAKKTAETDSAKAPGKAHTAEDQQLATAKAGAAAAGAQAMNTLTATRAAAGKAVDGGKGETKSKDERKRAEVTAKLQKVFDATKKDVETTLTGLDQKVDTAFTTGEKSARDAFTADHKARMKKYKDKRYGGFLGKGRWLKDKFAGMPQEANDLYQESRKLYVARMRTVISSVADMIGVELGRAKARIAQGRSDLKAEVDKLPADLKSFGEEAQQDFAGKFEDLEASVDEKSQQLVQDLANKYTAALNAVDEEIKKLQEANKGLIDKAKDAIVGVIKTINELKNLLLGILAKAASAIMKIIKDPIGFLGNLVKAVGAGLNLFVANIGDHLKKGLVSWLLGTATKAGLEIPERFDLRGIITLITSLLGLTWDNIRTRITRKGVPEEAMTAVESSVPVAQSLAKEGPAGAVKEIEAEAGDLKSTILSKLTEYLVPTVIIAGVTWILSLLNPASAFVRAVKGIIDIVTFVVNQGAQIADFVNAVLDAVIEIANGGAAGVPKMVETALAASIPLLIGFLASLLGIGNLANKVKSVFQAVSKPVNRAIDKIVDFIARKGKALWQKLKTKKPENNDGKGAGTGKRDGKNGAEEKILGPVGKHLTWAVHSESHRLWIERAGRRYVPMVASTPHPVAVAISKYREQVQKADPTGEKNLAHEIDEADKRLNSLTAAIADLEVASESGAAEAVIRAKKAVVGDAQEKLKDSISKVQNILGSGEDERLEKVRAQFGMEEFSNKELADFLVINRTAASYWVGKWREKGLIFRIESHRNDPYGVNTFDPTAAELRDANQNNRHRYGYSNPAKTSVEGLVILTKGLLGSQAPDGSLVRATPTEEKDASYHQNKARYKSVVNPSKYPNFGFEDAILGHAGEGASGHWNKYGHMQTREKNIAWNRDPVNYHGPEHKEESSASGGKAQRYRVPCEEDESHESWWKGV
ncbi:phage tail protein [Streptomyces hydrogenans]|uniref:phage tail protein n=1 Tax=Streptomyces hydrogenans TaxID=1873719 RepID=UPI0035DB16B5